jgi:hypothetical protein
MAKKLMDDIWFWSIERCTMMSDVLSAVENLES